MSFVIDTKGQRDPSSSGTVSAHEDQDSEDDFHFIPLSSTSDSMRTKEASKVIDFEQSYFDFGTSKNEKLSVRSLAQRYSRPEAVLKNSVISPGMEKLQSLPSFDEGRRQLLRKRKLERGKTTGSKWYNMKAPEMTEELKNDLEVLRMRSALDPKHFYKNNDIKVLPKYFQVGRIVESAADFYHSRIPKKLQKKTLVDELLADAEFQKSTKQRFKKIITK